MQYSWRAATALVILLAAAARLYNIDFGLPAVNDPDELMFELGALRMLRTGTLNPGWFGHPATTTMYGLALANLASFGVGRLLGWYHSQRDFADAIFADPSLVILPGRLLMAAFGVLTVGLTARFGKLLHNQRTGLIAALLLAVSPVAVHWAQVIRSDIMASAFMMLCLLATLRFMRAGQRRDLVISGVWLGIAVATKWPFAIAGAGLLAVLASQLANGTATPRQTLGRAAGFLGVAAGTLVLTSPYLVLAHDVVLRNLQGEAQAQHLGATGGWFAENAIWYIRGPLLSAIGLPGLVLSLAGLVLAARHRETALIVLPVMALFFLVLVSQHIVWERWILPLLPLAALFAAISMDRMAHWAASRMKPAATPRGGLAAISLLAVACSVPLAITAVFEARARANDTRQIAARWAASRIPPGSTVLIEHFGFDLYARPWRILFPLGTAGCVDARAMLAGKIDYAKIEKARGGRSNVDYGTVDPALAETCSADFAILTQADRYLLEKNRFHAEAQAYQKLLNRGVTEELFLPLHNISAGPTVRIVRFQK